MPLDIDKNRSIATTAHWGTYYAEVENGKLTALKDYEKDLSPSIIGQAVVPVLKSLGMHVFEVETDEEAAEAIEAGLKMAFVSNAAVAVLIGQKLIGAKSFIADVAEEVINVEN